MAFEPTFTITNGIAGALTRIERARGFLEAATLSDEWIREMEHRALVLEAHHTTHIEGTQLTLDQAERLLNGQDVPEANADDRRELLNYVAAFELVSGYLDSGAPVTEGLVRQIHAKLVEGVRGGSAAPGEYRQMQNYVVNSRTQEVIYTPPPVHDVPVLMRELIDWLNADTDVHPVLVAGTAQFQLVHVHPFLDGNGRTSRLLSTLCLYRAGYDFKKLFTISEYYDRERSEFYAAIQGVREQGMDMSGWLEYFTRGLSTQMLEVRAKGERVIRTDLLARKHGLNARQNGILATVLESGHVTIQDCEHLLPDVSRRTLQRDLQKLVDAGILRARGETHLLQYICVGK